MLPWHARQAAQLQQVGLEVACWAHVAPASAIMEAAGVALHGKRRRAIVVAVLVLHLLAAVGGRDPVA